MPDSNSIDRQPSNKDCQRVDIGASTSSIRSFNLKSGEESSQLNTPSKFVHSSQSDSSIASPNHDVATTPEFATFLPSETQHTSTVVDKVTNTAIEGHQMQTQAKAGIHKPKRYPAKFQLYTISVSNLPSELSSTKEALESEQWRATMIEDIKHYKRMGLGA
ncbi:hypothetical protein EZV62_024866 [Acer yangbiense]|uniref:Reverse transcriptase Ty1/copia-type domain-containing protein n=1 Tax=Acer yangbiense TaxID=1000413 RepID=A0A5C7GWP0_9ROSI|nr:hypothetical protein EZV62_024866 [Acer yangbiense]